MRALPVIVALFLIFTAVPYGCGDEDCMSNDSTMCVDSTTYWVDSCGRRGDKKEECECGCAEDNKSCVDPCECIPSCEGRCCGPNGCGGNCADTCSATGRSCNYNTCECEGVCQPNCQDRICGSDGCDGECFPGCGDNAECNLIGQCECLFESCWGLCCNSGEVCDAYTGNCCLPECDTKDCGKDGCGGSCGECNPSSECCYDNICHQSTFCALVLDFSSGSEPGVPVSGVSVKALDNDTGVAIDGMECVSDSDGNVTFSMLPVGEVGFQVVGIPGEYVDTYQFNIGSPSMKSVLWIMDFSTYTAAPLIAGVTVVPEKGLVVGATYWEDAQGSKHPVGCSTVKTESESGDVRYFGDNDMPTKTLADDPFNGRDDINPLNGYWLIANVDLGVVTIGSYLVDQLLSSTSCVMFANSVCIANIYVEGASNPQPANCD